MHAPLNNGSGVASQSSNLKIMIDAQLGATSGGNEEILEVDQQREEEEEEERNSVNSATGD